MLQYRGNERRCDLMDADDVVKRQIDALEKADVAALKARFLELYGFECGATNARNLRRRLAYRVQELYFGGLSAEDRALLGSVADGDPAANLRIPGRKSVRFVKGTRLCRDWKGRTCEVLVRGENEFEYDGEIYRSLTAVAEKITGTHWNGRKFFGVKR